MCGFCFIAAVRTTVINQVGGSGLLVASLSKTHRWLRMTLLS